MAEDMNDNDLRIQSRREKYDRLERRVVLLEEFRQEIRILIAKSDEREIALHTWMRSIDKKFDLQSVESGRIKWLVITIVVGTVINFVFAGGLVVGGQ